MKITIAANSDFDYLQQHDHHIASSLILPKIERNEIYILWDDDEIIIGAGCE